MLRVICGACCSCFLKHFLCSRRGFGAKQHLCVTTQILMCTMSYIDALEQGPTELHKHFAAKTKISKHVEQHLPIQTSELCVTELVTQLAFQTRLRAISTHRVIKSNHSLPPKLASTSVITAKIAQSALITQLIINSPICFSSMFLFPTLFLGSFVGFSLLHGLCRRHKLIPIQVRQERLTLLPGWPLLGVRSSLYATGVQRAGHDTVTHCDINPRVVNTTVTLKSELTTLRKSREVTKVLVVTRQLTQTHLTSNYFRIYGHSTQVCVIKAH